MINVNWDAAINISRKMMGVMIIAGPINVSFDFHVFQQFIVDLVVAETNFAWKAVEFNRNLRMWNLV